MSQKYMFETMLYVRPADRSQRIKARLRLVAPSRYEAIDKFWEALLAAGFEVEYVNPDDQSEVKDHGG